MLRTKTNLLLLAISLLISIAACDSAEKKTEETKVVKDTVANTIDTTAVARPRLPGQ